MNIHADKAQENKDRAMANSSLKLKSVVAANFQSNVNRPEAQKKLQQVINNSPRLKQLKAYQEIANSSGADKQHDQSSPLNGQFLPGTAIQGKWISSTVLTPGVVDVESGDDESGDYRSYDENSADEGSGNDRSDDDRQGNYNSDDERLDQWAKFTGDELYSDKSSKQNYNSTTNVLTDTKAGTSRLLSRQEHIKLMNKIYEDIGRSRNKNNQIIKSFDVVWDRLNDRAIDGLQPHEHTSFVGRFTTVFKNEEDNDPGRFAFRQQVGHSTQVIRDLKNDSNDDESDDLFEKPEYTVDNTPLGTMEPDEEIDLAGCYREGDTLVTYDHPGNMGPFTKNDQVTYTFTSQPEIYNVETGEVVASHNPTTGTIFGKHPRVTISTP